MSSEWQLVRLQEVTSILGDGLHGTPEYDDDGEYYFINGNNLSNGYISISEKTRRVSHAEFLKHRKTLNDRTILVSINGTLGNIALYRGEKVILGKSACYFNVVDNVDKDFVRYVVSNDTFQNYIHSLATGSTIKNVSLKLMRDFTFLLPPLADQRKISEMLSNLDNRIALLRETNATLEAIAQALFKSWFVDFDPVRAKASLPSPCGRGAGGEGIHSLHPHPNPLPEGEGAVLPPEIAALFPDSFEESELGLVPKGWSTQRLEMFIELAYGKALKSTDRVPGDVPVYGSGGITGYHNKSLADGPSIIVGRKGTVGSLYWEDSPFFPIDTVFFVKSATPMTYCFYLLQMLGLNGMNTDAAVPGLNRNNVYRLTVPYPTREVLEAFDSVAKVIRERIFRNQQQAQALATLRDTLLPRLISGRLRLPEAEASIEESL